VSGYHSLKFSSKLACSSQIKQTELSNAAPLLICCSKSRDQQHQVTLLPDAEQCPDPVLVSDGNGMMFADDLMLFAVDLEGSYYTVGCVDSS